MKKRSIATITLSILTIISTWAEVLSIPDPMLEAAIRRQLGKAEGEITRDDMESLTELDASLASNQRNRINPKISSEKWKNKAL